MAPKAVLEREAPSSPHRGGNTCRIDTFEPRAKHFDLFQSLSRVWHAEFVIISLTQLNVLEIWCRDEDVSRR